MLSKVLGRIVMAILFFAVVTPVGLVMRTAGAADPLRRRLDREASSYWLVRDAARNERQTSITRQF